MITRPSRPAPDLVVEKTVHGRQDPASRRRRRGFCVDDRMETEDQLIRSLNTALIIAYCIFALAICTTLIRLFARGRLLRQLGLDDWLIAGAMVIGIALVPLNEAISRAVRQMIRAIFVEGPQSIPPSPTTLDRGSRAAKLNYVAGVLYLTELGAIKVSILAFYRRFLTLPTYHVILHLSASSIIIFTLASSVAFIFQCDPISKAWDLLVTVCRVDIPRLQLAICIFNLLSDVIILLLPVPAIWSLRVDIKKRFMLIGLFSMGVLGTIVTALRLRKVIELQSQDHNLASSFVLVADIIKWSQLEINLIITCANMPALAGMWKHLNGSLRSTLGATSSSHYGPRTVESGIPMEGPMPSACGKNLNVSRGSTRSELNDIIRSTTVVVKVEHANTIRGSRRG
ncbi:MAG: hypothetical protein M1816_002472 [Peltula sp. TS41687]|nr:MAG: hypothetical protein M1816_002472 [Peltula sp. TS41687]